jgi:hypothetical protein
MRPTTIATLVLLGLAAPAPAYALNGEVQETEAARMNALAGGPVSHCSSAMAAPAEPEAHTAMGTAQLTTIVHTPNQPIVKLGSRANPV